MKTKEEIAIEIRGLWTQFGSHVVHKDLDLTIRRGEIVSIVGGSGSGKTTLLNILAALDRPTGGTVLLDGKDWASISKKRTLPP